MEVKIEILKTNKLNQILIKQINNLKKTHWIHSIKSQKEWFNNNINSNDTHILLKNNKKLIGYNCLRKYLLNKKYYYLFDTFIIAKSYRGKGFSKLIMEANINLFSKKKLDVILFCDKGLIKYYKNFGWKIFKKSKKINDKKKLLIYKN